MKIYNLGSLNIDYVYEVKHFVRPGETLSSNQFHSYPGGKGLNQSIAASKAGAEVYHIGIIGHDGKMLTDTLEDSLVNTDYIKKENSPTGHAIIQVNQNGENCIILYGGCNQKITKEFIDEAITRISSEDILVLQNEVSNLDYILTVAKEKGLRVMLNPSPINTDLLQLDLSGITWLILNEIEGYEITGFSDSKRILDTLIDKYPNMKVILTLGSHYFNCGSAGVW